MQAQQAAREESGGREDRDGEGHLRGHEGAASAPGRPARAAAAVAQVAAEVEPRRGQGRPGPRERGGHEGEDGGEDHDSGVDAHRVDPRQAVRHERDHRPQERRGRRQADEAGREGQHQALREDRRSEPGGVRAERGADGQLVAACLRAQQQQVGDVRARDEDDEADRAEQDEDGRPHVPDHDLGERARHDREAARRAGRRGLLEPGDEVLQLLAGGVLRRARPQTADEVEVPHGLPERRRLERRRERVSVIHASTPRG